MHWAHFASAACFAAIAFRVCACAPVIWLWMNYGKKVGELLVASATVRVLLCESLVFWMNYKVRCVTHDKSLVKIALLPHGGITRSRRSFSRKRTQGHKADTHSRYHRREPRVWLLFDFISRLYLKVNIRRGKWTYRTRAESSPG